MFADFKIGIGGFFTDVAFAVAGAFGIIDAAMDDTNSKVATVLAELDAKLAAFETGQVVPASTAREPGVLEAPLGAFENAEAAARSAVLRVGRLTREDIWADLPSF